MTAGGKNLIYLIGKRFGRLCVIDRARPKYGRQAWWRCLCDCGNEVVVLSQSLRSGRTKSCGCLHNELLVNNFTKHGDAGRGKLTTEYYSWSSMLQRCNNPNNQDYHYYGGRGIKVCDRWSGSFENFLEDMGRKPGPKYSIDRYPNNDGNYEPGNCRWATYSEQKWNFRKSSKSK